MMGGLKFLPINFHLKEKERLKSWVLFQHFKAHIAVTVIDLSALNWGLKFKRNLFEQRK